MINIKTLKHVHLIGIGGVGVSGIAEILLSKGISISGSDICPNNLTKKLEKYSDSIFYEHSKENINSSIDLVVYSSAINNSNPEIIRAKELNIPMLSRSELLGLLMKTYKNTIAIAGSHGKTTTTSMISVIFDSTNLSPTLLIGAEVSEIGGNVKIGGTDLLVTEACEYRDNFLDFNYNIAVILNIDEDHLDYFKNLDQIINSFSKFAKKLPSNGKLIINGDDANSKELLSNLKINNVITFGCSNNYTYSAQNITYNNIGCPSFDVFFKNSFIGQIKLIIPGEHNIYNCLASIAVTHNSNVDYEIIKTALKTFKGASRRFEYKGILNKATIIDDYAHHPTEIKATLNAARKIHDKKIVVIFQPHTYSRTKKLLTEFSLAFNLADEIIITDIYPARETYDPTIHSKNLVNLLVKQGLSAKYIKSFEEISLYLKPLLDENCIIFTMGAGDIYKLSDQFINQK